MFYRALCGCGKESKMSSNEELAQAKRILENQIHKLNTRIDTLQDDMNNIQAVMELLDEDIEEQRRSNEHP